MAVTPAEAAVAAIADAAFPNNPLNHESFALSFKAVATFCPAATVKVWPTARILPDSLTSSTRYEPGSTPVNENSPIALLTVVAAILPVTTFRSRTLAPGIGVPSGFEATPLIAVWCAATPGAGCAPALVGAGAVPPGATGSVAPASRASRATTVRQAASANAVCFTDIRVLLVIDRPAT